MLQTSHAQFFLREGAFVLVQVVVVQGAAGIKEAFTEETTPLTPSRLVPIGHEIHTHLEHARGVELRGLSI